MSRPLDTLSEADSASVDYSFTDSVRTYDTLDDLLTRFTLEFRPEYVFKIRNRLGPLVLGTDLSHSPEQQDTQGAIVFKPTNRNQWWRRLRIDSTGGITLRSRKLRWWLFTLDLHGGVNAITRATDASFRVATKWDVARGEYHNKKKVALGDATEGRVHWSVNYNLPELAGSFGANNRDVSRDVHAEIGYAHAEVAKVELVVWPWRNNPQSQLRISEVEAGEERVVGGAFGNESEGAVAVAAQEKDKNKGAVVSIQNTAITSADNTSKSSVDVEEVVNSVEKKRLGGVDNFIGDLQRYVSELQGSWRQPTAAVKS